MKENGLRHIRRALLSVSDKSSLVEFARALQRFGIELISTGGTARALREAGCQVLDVAEITGVPEMLDGRVKTLHPRIHGAILARRDRADHLRTLREHGIETIDMVVVNLYPFEQTVAQPGTPLEEAIEQIDIGGPAMIRSAAKNWQDVAVVVSPELYGEVIAELERCGGALTRATRLRLARHAFERTAHYDAAIAAYLATQEEASDAERGASNAPLFPPLLALQLRKTRDLRYGENPHQAAALYAFDEEGGIAHAAQLSGKEMSFNNYIDADAAWQLVNEFSETACAIIKHTNPAGVALGTTPEEAYRRALETDPISAFGGIVAFNRTLDERAARAVTEIFTEVVIAPDYDREALAVLRSKKSLRVLRVAPRDEERETEWRTISGGLLVQTRDRLLLNYEELRTVTRRAPTSEEMEALLFAWTVCKHTKSNAIVYARLGQTVGVGAGQMSRVDSVRIGAARARLPLDGSVLASDAFFPFRDGIDEAARHGITAVIQPGGSVRDEEVIAAADEHGLAMIFTGVRHFKH